MRATISGTKSTTRNLDTKLHQLDKEAARQQELLYNAEFQIQQIERKVARGLGERSDEEKRALKKEIEACEGRLDESKEKRKMLNAQLRKLHNEYVSSVTRKEDLEKQREKYKERQGELELENRMIEEEIRRDTKEKEEIVVQNDLLRLEVRRLRDLLSAKADAVFSLENRKQQLLLSMDERKQEISVHRDVLKAELRTIGEDKHKVMLDLRTREQNVGRLKARYEAINRDVDQTHSQSYYIILAAQKREELQRKGDELDTEIRRCEREIRALQTTLDHLNARNTAFRESFQKVDFKGEDVDVLRQLEERLKLGKDALFSKKKELQRLVTDHDEDTRRLDQLKVQNAKVTKQKEHLSNAKGQVEEEILTQQKTLDDLHDKVSRLALKHRTKLSQDNQVDIRTFANGSLEEKSARSEVIKDVVQNVLYTLGQLANEFPEVSDTLASRLQDADLRVPVKPPTRSATLASAPAAGARRGSPPTGGGMIRGAATVQPSSFDMGM